MANIALLVPNDELFRLSHDVLQEMKKRLFLMKVIETESAVTEARQAINQGADIIIARGLQATVIKQYTDVSVVEIIMTRQGLINMLERAKRILGKKNPNIAIVMSKNMACDMTGIGEKCGVNLREYLIQNPELLKSAAMQAIEDKADLIIGGSTVLSMADNAGIPALYLANTEDAVKNAIKEAFLLADTFENGEIPVNGIRIKEKGAGKEDNSFVNFPYKSQKMQKAVDLAEKLSKTDCPKIIVEPVGNLHRAFINAIHNSSKHSKEKLVIYDCEKGKSAYDDLYGRNGKVNDSLKGSLVINNIEYLDERSQKKLLEILMFRHVIMVAKNENYMVHFIPDLYARMSAFVIKIPSLSETPEDIAYLANVYMQSVTERYGKYHILTKDGEKELELHGWNGGRIQLESFIERLVISAEHRNLKAADIKELYDELYGKETVDRLSEVAENCSESGDMVDETIYDKKEDFGMAEFSGNGKRVIRNLTVQDLERDRILKIISKNMGNREKTAAELGISKTTLWRKLKRYDIL
ncbi:PrpR N-terminal domain-containing protein [Oribacterium sp. WCC10]|uniref:PrpR N-terminal domain-containing protein n=1 Tax=Oribacterium sp. WCC10 TaxID=1855343 RepID=UPI0008E68628|nr:PrpR N-terminal domain-containing protein [Oribacterium sp. WCC10]SFG77309.1 DNA-binding transcriptional response regulator, NtrC family, contains REC, AAA-type ATPase, and a Fis-type DNA-binding domains [Oribacterium sp. WCC10]